MLQIKKASAGSGKTFTLARQYVTHLIGRRDRKTGRMTLYTPKDYGFLKPKAHARILAITFTNKATQEMTSRIIKELALLAVADNNPKKKSDHIDHLCKVYNADAHAVAESARRALTDLLFNFSSFNVSTIDAFFQSVLHVFTRELDLPEAFALEIDETYPVSVAVGDMMQMINLPTEVQSKERQHRLLHLKNWLVAYMESLIDNGRNANLLSKSSVVNRALIKTMTRLRGEEYKTHRKDISDYLSDPQRLDRFIAGLSKTLEIMRSRVHTESQAFMSRPEAKMIDMRFRSQYTEKWAVDDFSYDPLEGKRRETYFKRLNGEKIHNAPQKGEEPWSADLVDLYLNLLQRGWEYFVVAKFFKILQNQIYILGLFSETERHIDEYCKTNEAFLLGDTNELLHKVITDTETPFVYERIGTTINHFLIDEFQDTSEMQWDNLAPLLRESLSREQYNLIIGDEKQCIYRFRNSKPELLGHEVQQEMSTTFGADAVEVITKENTNWRSKRNVVLFNNSLFQRLAVEVDSDMPTPMAVPTYASLIQEVCPKNQKPDKFPGYVKMLFGPMPTGTDSADSADDPKQPDANAPWDNDKQLQLMIDEIDRQLSAGYRPKDICVLVRQHTEGEAVIDAILQTTADPKSGWRHGPIKIMSDDALEVSSSPSVQLIIGILRLCTTPQYVIDDNKTQEEAILEENRVPNPEYLRNRLIHRYELCRFDRTEEIGDDGNPVMGDDGMPVTRLLTPTEALQKALKATALHPGSPELDPLQKQLDAVVMEATEMDCPSIYAIVERIIKECLPSQSLSEDVPFISAFQDIVLDFEETGVTDIDSFLEWWDTKGRKVALPAPEGMDALSVMTIHQAKGLEVPCVHVPFCEQKLFKTDELRWYGLDKSKFPGIQKEDIPPYIPLIGNELFSMVPMLGGQYNRNKLTQIVDNLNIYYVAFTRAENELIIYSNPAANGEHFSGLMKRTLDKEDPQLDDPNLIPLSPHWHVDAETGASTFELGSPTVVYIPEKKDEEEEAEANVATDVDYESFVENYPSNRPANMPLPDDAEEQGVFDPSNERHVGNFLHSALAHVRTVDQLPLAMERAAYRRALPEEYWRPILRTLQAALEDSRVKPWYEGFSRVHNERPLTSATGVRRPDRVIYHPDGSVTVVDYKFGSPTEKYRELYRDQVRDYMALLAECGFRNIRGYLFYPLAGKIFSAN